MKRSNGKRIRRKQAAMLALCLAAVSLTGIARSEPIDDPAVWLSGDQYYRAQLSEAHLEAWRFDLSNVLSYPAQTPAEQSDPRLQALGPMIKLDNPRIFWVDWINSTGMLCYDTGMVLHGEYKPLVLPEGETLSALKQRFLEAVDADVVEIRASLAPGDDPAAIARAVHDWLCVNNTYNADETSASKSRNDPVSFAYLAAHSAYSAIIPVDGYEPVCEGYAGAFKILCNALGVDCVCVSGRAEGYKHMWNCVRLEDGDWYLVDVDSDDLDGKGAEYDHSFFMIDSAQAQDYVPDPYVGSGVKPENGYEEGAAFEALPLHEAG